MTRLLLPLSLLLVLLAALPVAAHTDIASSTPAADSTVTDPPSELVVEFVGDLEPGSAVVARVVDPSGDDLVAGEGTVAGRTATIPLNQAVAAGVHTVDVAYTAADGDDQVATFTFTFAPAAGVATPTQDLTGPPVEPATEPATDPVSEATGEPATEAAPEAAAAATSDPTPTASEAAEPVSAGGVGALPIVVALLAIVGTVAVLALRRRDPDQHG